MRHRFLVEVDAETVYRTPEDVVANWRKLTKAQLISTLCVYNEGMAELHEQLRVARIPGRRSPIADR